jgi:hypothetical protein
MNKHIVLLSGDTERRKSALQVINRVLVADSNSVYADVISIEDFARSELKAAYSDFKKQYKRALHSSRNIIVVNIPGDTKNAWQSYVDLAMMEPMMTFQFHGIEMDGKPHSINTKHMPFTMHNNVSDQQLESILRTVLTGQS